MNKWQKFLCKIGLHKWDYIKNGFEPDRFRKCKRCSKVQMFDDFSLDYIDSL